MQAYLLLTCDEMAWLYPRCSQCAFYDRAPASSSHLHAASVARQSMAMLTFDDCRPHDWDEAGKPSVRPRENLSTPACETGADLPQGSTAAAPPGLEDGTAARRVTNEEAGSRGRRSPSRVGGEPFRRQETLRIVLFYSNVRRLDSRLSNRRTLASIAPGIAFAVVELSLDNTSTSLLRLIPGRQLTSPCWRRHF